MDDVKKYMKMNNKGLCAQTVLCLTRVLKLTEYWSIETPVTALLMRTQFFVSFLHWLQKMLIYPTWWNNRMVAITRKEISKQSTMYYQ